MYSTKVISGSILVEDVKKFLERLRKSGCFATFINSEYVVSKEVLEFAAEKAIKSWNEKRRVAKSLEMEILLYVAATRQIDKAKKIGIKEGFNKVYLITTSDCYEKIKNLTSFEEMNFDKTADMKKIIELYNISRNELEIVGLEKLPLLIRERIVLFDLFK